jgi:hypothetical protein
MATFSSWLPKIHYTWLPLQIDGILTLATSPTTFVSTFGVIVNDAKF